MTPDGAVLQFDKQDASCSARRVLTFDVEREFARASEIGSELTNAVERAAAAEKQVEGSISDALVCVYRQARLALVSVEHQEWVNEFVRTRLAGHNGITAYDIRKNSDNPFGKLIWAAILEPLAKDADTRKAQVWQYSQALLYCSDLNMSSDEAREALNKHGVIGCGKLRLAEPLRPNTGAPRDDGGSPKGSAEDDDGVRAGCASAEGKGGGKPLASHSMQSRSGLMLDDYLGRGRASSLLQTAVLSGPISAPLEPGFGLFIGRVTEADGEAATLSIFGQFPSDLVRPMLAVSTLEGMRWRADGLSSEAGPVFAILLMSDFLGVQLEETTLQIRVVNGRTLYVLPGCGLDVLAEATGCSGLKDNTAYALSGVELVMASGDIREGHLTNWRFVCEDDRVELAADTPSMEHFYDVERGESVLIDQSFDQALFEPAAWCEIDTLFWRNLRAARRPQVVDTVPVAMGPQPATAPLSFTRLEMQRLAKAAEELRPKSVTMRRSTDLLRLDLDLGSYALSVVKRA